MTRFARLLLVIALLSIGVNSPPAAAQDKEETTKRLTEKVQRVSAGAQKWAASGRDASEIVKTMQEEFQPLMEAGKVVEAEVVLDRMLKTLGLETKAPSQIPTDAPSAEERVLTRIHLIQKELPAWVKKTGNQKQADALMQTLKEQLAAESFAEAEKTANSILKLMGVSLPTNAPAAARPVTSSEASDAANPFAAFFPYQMVMLARDHIGMTPEQYESLRAKVNATQPRLEKLQIALEQENSALTELMSEERLEEEAILTQLDKFLDVERETKRLQVGLGVAIQNLLNSQQQTKLRELTENPDAVKKLEQNLNQRITAKAERVQAVAERWAQSGRDPSPIAQMMEERVKPLMEAKRVFEAEVELNLVLEEIAKDSK